jgi:pyruvate/2-oxoglutarate/acetoin dehydrogenase E1 component
MSTATTAETATKRLNYLAAIREAQLEEMRRDESVIVLGEDVEAGVFGTTTGFVDEFGKSRVRNTPLSEAGFCGAAVGAAMTGMRPIVDLTIASFLYVAMDQIVSQAAKTRYMFGGQPSIPVVYRGAMFYGGADAAHHSDRPYPMFMNVPGLKLIAPSSPTACKGLLKAAIRDDDPVICFEDKTLWGSREEVPADEDFLIPLGKAAVLREGADATVVAIAGAVPLALRAAEALAEGGGGSVEVIDPQSLAPLDRETIIASVAKTKRLLVVDPAHRTCGAAAEICASVTEEIFGELAAAPRRLNTPDVHIPFSPAMEKPLFPDAARIESELRELLA